MTITEFLEARIAEDEAVAHNVLVFRINPATGLPGNQAITARVLAECAAKRALIAEIESDEWMDSCGCLSTPAEAHLLLCHLAAVYKDHPDYRQVWAA